MLGPELRSQFWSLGCFCLFPSASTVTYAGLPGHAALWGEHPISVWTSTLTAHSTPTWHPPAPAAALRWSSRAWGQTFKCQLSAAKLPTTGLGVPTDSCCPQGAPARLASDHRSAFCLNFHSSLARAFHDMSLGVNLHSPFQGSFERSNSFWPWSFLVYFLLITTRPGSRKSKLKICLEIWIKIKLPNSSVL